MVYTRESAWEYVHGAQLSRHCIADQTIHNISLEQPVFLVGNWRSDEANNRKKCFSFRKRCLSLAILIKTV